LPLVFWFITKVKGGLENTHTHTHTHTHTSFPFKKENIVARLLLELRLGIGSPLLLIKSKVAFLLMQKEMVLPNLKLKQGKKMTRAGIE
jgi:hypothetical protein